MLYYPYGETRWSDGTLPTDYQFTGQRADSYIDMYQMGARWYNPYINRWIQPDTIIPDPANPQSLNRFSYVLENPLRYSDPTGYFSEEEIMGFFGVEAWKEVLAFFEEGGYLEGKWGWLEVLRKGQVGEHVYIAEDSGLWLRGGSSNESLTMVGTFSMINDWLYIKREDVQGYVSFDIAPFMGNYYRVESRTYLGCCAIFDTSDERIHYHTKFDPDRVNWTDFTLDGVGVIAGLVAANEFVEVVQVAPDVVKTARYADTGLNWFGLGKSLLVDVDPNAAWVTAGGFIPGPIGGGFNVASMYWDLKPGFYQVP